MPLPHARALQYARDAYPLAKGLPMSRRITRGCRAVCLAAAVALPAGGASADDLRIKMLEVGAADRAASDPAAQGPAKPATDGSRPLSDREMAEHVLSRLSFGPRPGDIEAVLAEGWEYWARKQLRPDTLDDGTAESRVASDYPSLSMSMAQIFAAYRPPYKNDPPTRAEEIERNRLHKQVRRELRESVIHRAVHSNAQFREVIAEFWRNHFNVGQQKDDVGYLANHYEMQVIRAHAFGNFEDMLLASARHPAMLIYLDNIVSQKPLNKFDQRLIERYEGRERKPRSVRALERYSGLNENYARELMELHTLGVDNGYTQHDVTELARVLTGWTARWHDNGEYGFYFRADVHDTDAKRLLGASLRRGGGEDEGVAVIRGLARDKRTAQFVSWKLCKYLVNDQPDPALVSHVAGVFRKTGGDLPKVYEAIIFSPQFQARDNYRVKFKTPFEFVVSALRATDAQVKDYGPTLRAVQMMGQPVYQMEDPTGYDDQAERWLDPGVLVSRWRFALDLGRNRLPGVKVPQDFGQPFANLPPQQIKDALVGELIPAGIDERTDEVLTQQIKHNGSFEHALGLVLGSPAFQQQ